MGYGIAFGGGGTRGAAHVGVLLAMQEAELMPTSVAGASSGAIVAGLYASGISVMKLKEIVGNLQQNGRMLFDPDISGIIKGIMQLTTGRKITLTGLLKGNRLERFLGFYTQNLLIKDAKMTIVIPAVDVNSGQTVVYTNNILGLPALNNVVWRDDVTLAQAIRASTAIPAVFQPKDIGAVSLLDGGITDNLPVNLLMSVGEKNILAVDVSGSYKPFSCENLLEISSHTLAIMNSRLKQCSASAEKLLLTPKLPDEAGLLDFKNMTACMQEGYEAAKKMLPVIRALMSS